MTGEASGVARRNRVLFTAGMLTDRHASKTAVGVLRFQPETVKGILDPRFAGRSLLELCPWLPRTAADVPIGASLEQLAQRGDELVVGFAAPGGRFTADQRELLLRAVSQGIRVINGLHDLLPPSDLVTNLRSFDDADRVVAEGADYESVRILTVGTSHGAGKMTATVFLYEDLRRRGVNVDWVATGQTGMLLRGRGRVIDAIPIDFVPGVIERLILTSERTAEVVVVEGQGSLFHRSFAPSTFALLDAARPQYLVLCHRLGERTHAGFRQALPSVEGAVTAYQQLADALQIPTRLLGICLDTADFESDDAERACVELGERLGIPCLDAVRDGVGRITERLLAAEPWIGNTPVDAN